MAVTGATLSASALGLILLAAALHATWNAIVKSAGNTLFTSIAVAFGSGTIAALALPAFAAPAPASWPFILGSVACQIIYYALIATVYRIADMSRTYPIMRGTAPLIVALVSGPVIGETLSPLAWAGLAVVCSAVIGLAWPLTAARDRRGVLFALLNAGVIASYTLIDGIGVRRSGAPIAYTLWIFALTAVPLTGWALLRHGAAFTRYVRANLHHGVIGGLGNLGSYGLALWAMTAAPVAVVATLRETSMLFATAISVFILKEAVNRRRLAMIALIVTGVALLRVA